MRLRTLSFTIGKLKAEEVGVESLICELRGESPIFPAFRRDCLKWILMLAHLMTVLVRFQNFKVVADAFLNTSNQFDTCPLQFAEE